MTPPAIAPLFTLLPLLLPVAPLALVTLEVVGVEVALLVVDDDDEEEASRIQDVSSPLET